jgi:hypothetical protein
MTARELANRMKARAESVEPEFRKTTKGLATEALAFCRKRMTDLIYANAIPTRPRSGKPMWRRTGNLRRSERVELRDSYTAVVVNDANYALPRHEMGKDGHRQTRFPAHWRDELREVFAPKCIYAYRKTVENILRKGGL